jgi:uncharacterized membrane protein
MIKIKYKDSNWIINDDILVSDIVINGNFNSDGEYLIIDGEVDVVDGIAYIKGLRSENSIARHLAKTISWRVVGTLDTMLLAWIITGDLNIGLAIGGTEVITKMILYFIHERIWFKFIKIGRD